MIITADKDSILNTKGQFCFDIDYDEGHLYAYDAQSGTVLAHSDAKDKQHAKDELTDHIEMVRS